MDDRFDPNAGKAGKQEGMDRAELHADPEWWRIMLVCVKAVAERRPFFTTDEIEALRRERYPNHTTHEPRAIGPLMREAAKLGYCERTGEWYESTQRQNHRRPMRLWSSLIYRGPPPKLRPRQQRVDPRQMDLFE